MKKMKKLVAALLTLAMVLGMSMTTMAATPAEGVDKTNGKIIVKGLTKEETTVKLYKVVGWSREESKWTVENWANDYVDLEENPVKINYEGLYEIASDDNVYNNNVKTTETGTVEFDNLDIGAYMVIAAGATTEYNVMGSFTYGYDENHIMVPTDVTIQAKASDYAVTKTLNGDSFVGRGDVVDFTINTVFPSYKEGETDRTFWIKDKPTGMKLTEITVSVGGNPVIFNQDYTLTPDLPYEGEVTINFTEEFIGNNNLHAGEAVVVDVKAEVTAGDGFKNEAETNKGGNTETPAVGDTGTITIKKMDEEDNPLDGALFSVAPKDGEKIQFVEEGKGIYHKANDEEIKNEEIVKHTTDLLAADGKLVVKGLDDGTYTLVEEQAPDGYSVVSVPEQIIAAGDKADITVNVKDTKLASLPGTGGIGTTIFTIGGCAIMIAAAAFFFLSRRKENN